VREGGHGHDQLVDGGSQAHHYVNQSVRVLNVGGAHEPGVVEGDVLGVPGDVVAGQRVVVNEFVQHLEFKAFDEVERFGAEGENEGEAVGLLGNSLRLRLVEQDVLHRDQLALSRGFWSHGGGGPDLLPPPLHPSRPPVQSRRFITLCGGI